MEAAELINAAIDELHSSTPLSIALLKVKTIAFLIKNQQLKDWVSLELNGYGEDSTLPHYRKVVAPPHCILIHQNYFYNKAHQNDVLVPIEYLSSEDKALIAERNFTHRVIEIEDWAKSETGIRIEISTSTTSYISNKLYTGSNSEWSIYKAWQDLPCYLFKGMLLTIRDTVLELLLNLSEFENITLQSLQQKQAVDETVSKALNSITVTGGNVNISHGAGAVQAANSGNAVQLNMTGANSTQSITPTQAASLRELVEQLKPLIAQEPSLKEYREEMEQEVERIEVQLQKPEPKKGILKRAFESLQDLAVKGVGTASGHAMYELLKQAPDLLDAIR